jgi:IS30 family transposase
MTNEEIKREIEKFLVTNINENNIAKPIGYSKSSTNREVHNNKSQY